MGVQRLSQIRVNVFNQIPGTAGLPSGPQKQSRMVWCKQKASGWSHPPLVKSAPLPDSILVSPDPGSKLTPDEPQKSPDIYSRGSLFLSCNASFCVFSWTPNNPVWEQKFNDRLHTGSPQQASTDKNKCSLKIWESKCMKKTISLQFTPLIVQKVSAKSDLEERREPW